MDEPEMNLQQVKIAIDENNDQMKEKLTGYLSNLHTENKNTLVAAINEVYLILQ